MGSTCASMHVLWRGDTVHLFAWVINHADVHQLLATSLDDMRARLDALVLASSPLQAWHATATWQPAFDLADGWKEKVYEDMSVLNFFRGILLQHQCALKQHLMTAQWCANVLRMVSPYMWLCSDLLRQVDMPALERVAVVSRIDGSARIEKCPDCRWMISNSHCCRCFRLKAAGSG